MEVKKQGTMYTLVNSLFDGTLILIITVVLWYWFKTYKEIFFSLAVLSSSACFKSMLHYPCNPLEYFFFSSSGLKLPGDLPLHKL
jgi:hypothetical protein